MVKRAALTPFVALLVAVASTTLALADEPASYSFASAQSAKTLAAAPGAEVKGILYFYNVDGNRLTHILLRLERVPAGWEASLNPPAQTVTYQVDGRETVLVENVAVEPTHLLAAQCGAVPLGTTCLSVPGRGFAVARLVTLSVKVPGDTPLGQTADLRVVSEAAWLGQTGAAIIKQTRDFDFTIAVARASGLPVETRVEPSPKPDPRLLGGVVAALTLGVVLVGRSVRRRGRGQATVTPASGKDAG